MDILLDLNTRALLHHKYALADAELSDATQFVITGSHNWTSAAESSNNENTLIIRNNGVANFYLQEFAARYKAAGGQDNIVVSVANSGNQIPSSLSLAQNYPNPFNGTTNFEFRVAGFLRQGGSASGGGFCGAEDI